MFTVYVIQNDSGKKYVGYTADLEKRLLRHNGELPTKKRSFTSLNRVGKWVLIYKETFQTRTEAGKRERELKSAKGREFLYNLPHIRP